jgi:N-acetylglucosamine-6-sulfatase
MSVDDLISEVIQTVDDLGLSDRTYFFYSSDHGFQLGQFNILMDKRRVYEWDTKIHLLVRGPGIKAGGSFAQPGTQVDIAPTLLGLAGLEAPDTMDGRSVVPFLVDPQDPSLAASTKRHLAAIGNLQSSEGSWRQDVFIEHYYCEYNIKCVDGPKTTCKAGNYPERDSTCVDLTPGANADCWCQSESYPVDLSDSCYATEDPGNNFIAVRNLTAGENIVYVEYQTGDLSKAQINFEEVDFVEYYDLSEDDVQLKNLAKGLNAGDRARLSARVRQWLGCSGKSCP